MSTLFPLSSWARRWALVAGCVLGFGATASAQAPANDDCANAITLTPSATCVPTAGTTIGATASIPGGPTGNPTNAIACPILGIADDDVWYKFIATATSHAITVAGSSTFDAVVDLRSGACPGTNFSCIDDGGPGDPEYKVITGLMVGSTYYIRIYSLAGAGAQGTFTVCVSAAPNCAGPTGLVVGSIAGNTATVGFTASASPVTGYTVTYTPTSPTPGPPVTVTVTGSPVNLTGLTLGTTYTVTVTGNCTSGGASNPVTTTFATTGVANDDCSVAVPLTPGVSCVPTSGTTAGATQSLNPITCGSRTAAGSRGDVWYKFVAFGTAATVIVAGGTGFDPVIDIRTACPVPTTSSSFACMDATMGGGTTETLNLTGLMPGSTYWIRVYNFLTANGTFNICVTGVPCVAPTSLAATNVTATGATLTFTPPAANGISYTVTYTPTAPTSGASQTQTSTTSPITLTGLTPSTTYSVSLVTNCSATNSSAPVTTTFTTFAACPAPTGIAATNLTSTSATITFTPPASGPVGYTVTYTQTSPTVGTPLTQSGTGSPITINGLTPGAGYTVSLVSNCSTTGTAPTSAPLTVNFITPSICAPVTGLAVSAISANSATVTFTPAPTGTTYTILYSALGQATQVLTTANSPATLTGLLAGQAYTINVVSTCGSSQTSVVATATFNTAAAAPTGGSAIQIQPTSANITFTAPAGAVAYTITYTAAGNTGTTTGTAPPMALTNLTPNTTYTVTIVATYPGGGQSAPITFTFTTGVLATRSALAGGELAVFPNPAHASFTVSLPALGAARTAQLELVNTLGQRVRQQTLVLTAGGTQAAVDASSLPAGIYLLRVQAGGETAVTRVVLE